MSLIWDFRFLRLAQHTANWSKDPSTQVGAVIVGPRRIVLALGYNGLPRGIADTEQRLLERAQKYSLTVHAEINALHNAAAPVIGATLYTWPLAPCQPCALQIIQAGIARVVAPTLTATLQPRWHISTQQAAALFTEAGITLDHIDLAAPDNEATRS